MRLHTLSIFGTITLAALSFAAPVSQASHPLEARCVCEDIEAILMDVTSSITPLFEELTYITSENATVEILTPIVAEIKSGLLTAIAKVKALPMDRSLTSILTTVDGTVLTITEVAELICTLLNIIFPAVVMVSKVVTSENFSGVVILLVEVVELVGSLLQCLISAVGGLLPVLVPLVDSVVYEVAVELGVTNSFLRPGQMEWSTASATLIPTISTVVFSSATTLAMASTQSTVVATPALVPTSNSIVTAGAYSTSTIPLSEPTSVTVISTESTAMPTPSTASVAPSGDAGCTNMSSTFGFTTTVIPQGTSTVLSTARDSSTVPISRPASTWSFIVPVHTSSTTSASISTITITESVGCGCATISLASPDPTSVATWTSSRISSTPTLVDFSTTVVAASHTPSPYGF